MLSIGGEFLVRGAAQFARARGVPALIVGLTVVSMGTSAPELVVCITSAWRGEDSLVLGNAVGSNIINVLLVLGLAAVIAPIPVRRRLFQWDMLVMVGASLLLIALSLGKGIGRVESAGMLILMFVYLRWTVLRARQHREETLKVESELPGRPRSTPVCLIMIAIGLVGLTAGARWMVEAATTMAEALHVPKIIIGVTILAMGTSLPELATFVVAAIHKHQELAVGNIIGSNIFNILGILGASGLVHPLGIEADLFGLHYPMMVLAAVLLGVVFWTGQRVTRWEGMVLLVFYALYAWRLVLVGRGAA